MRKFFLSLLLFLFISNASFGLNNYKSIEEVKSLNYELFEEIGLDENKINYLSRVIYSSYKKSQHITANGASPQKAFIIDKAAEEMLLRVLTQTELKMLKTIKHKLK